jgi:hypothetical protein
MKKILSFFIVNNLIVFSATAVPPIIPKTQSAPIQSIRPITPPVATTLARPVPVPTFAAPVLPPAPVPGQPMPITTAKQPTAGPIISGQTTPIPTPIAAPIVPGQPTPITPQQPTAVPVAPITPQPTKDDLVKDDLATVNIQNLSNKTAIIKDGTATINDKKNQSISINTSLQPNQKEAVTIFTYVSNSNQGGLEFNNLTSITINEQKLSLNPPVTQSENIYIDNDKGTWKIVPKPKESSSPKGNQSTPTKGTLITPVTKAALNLQSKTPKSSAAKTTKSVVAKTTTNSAVPPIPKAPESSPAKK